MYEVAQIFNNPLIRESECRSDLIKAGLKDHNGMAYQLVDFPFSVHGSRNVELETVKRGESDFESTISSTKTVVLRLFERLGGAASVTLNMSVSFISGLYYS